MDNMQFTPIKQSPVSKRVSEQIKTLIMEGNLKPGDRLPSERDLAKRIQVGRLSLREGLRILESMGIVETKYGVNSGTYVSRIGIENLAEKFSDVLKLGNFTLEKLYEARLEISLIALKYFIERGNAHDIRRMEECIKEAEQLLKLGMQTREKNLYFQQLIAQGSKNPVFILIQNSLFEAIRQFLSKFESPHQHSKEILAGNKRILRYLKEKNLESASKAMRSHLFYSMQSLKSLINKTSKKRTRQ
jgi:GntR family transcriptional repressor for pyruvate dehydrogenase complex